MDDSVRFCPICGSQNIETKNVLGMVGENTQYECKDCNSCGNLYIELEGD